MKAHESQNLNVLPVIEWLMKQKRLKKLYEMKNPKSAQGGIETKEIENMESLHMSRWHQCQK